MSRYSEYSSSYETMIARDEAAGFTGDTITQILRMADRIVSDSVICACGFCDRQVPVGSANRCFITGDCYHDDCWSDHVDGIKGTTRLTLTYYVLPCVPCQERREREREALNLVPTVEMPDLEGTGKTGVLA
jgi:hypothetical protein